MYLIHLRSNAFSILCGPLTRAHASLWLLLFICVWRERERTTKACAKTQKKRFFAALVPMLKKNTKCRMKLGKLHHQCLLKMIRLVVGFVWFVIIFMVSISDPSSPHSSLSGTYFIPLSVFIPERVYSLATSISNSSLSTPVIPTFVEDLNTTVLSVRASRMRSSGSATFIVARQRRTLNVDLWCLFGEESITPVYTYHVGHGENRRFFLVCSLPESIRRDLWYNRTEERDVRIYLSTSTRILLQGFLEIPWSNSAEDNEQSLTLCAFSSSTPARYLLQWIEYHRLVGIHKFVIYLLSDEHRPHLQTIVNAYEHEYPGLIDTIEWNVTVDEVQYDCFLQYADVSEWIAMVATNEYLIPSLPYQTLTTLLAKEYGRDLQKLAIFVTHEYCSHYQWERSNEEVLIEQSVLRLANVRVVSVSHKSLYRSRTLHSLAMLNENQENAILDSSQKSIVLARYPASGGRSNSTRCALDMLVIDTTICERSGERLRKQLLAIWKYFVVVLNVWNKVPEIHRTLRLIVER